MQHLKLPSNYRMTFCGLVWHPNYGAGIGRHCKRCVRLAENERILQSQRKPPA